MSETYAEQLARMRVAEAYQPAGNFQEAIAAVLRRLDELEAQPSNVEAVRAFCEELLKGCYLSDETFKRYMNGLLRQMERGEWTPEGKG